jgi:hypothetical protein
MCLFKTKSSILWVEIVNGNCCIKLKNKQLNFHFHLITNLGLDSMEATIDLKNNFAHGNFATQEY